ncbi:hypothetical protein Pint_33673 [Pistacia integerrima]|uniref:Uncharacterized protein n=1 Tax=Pistacia integerrima TaxID=434235 RepID=A0ACC0X533_9ROSI|nr:hypothetical protein Pint_33673 [Pistacia integerrima]
MAITWVQVSEGNETVLAVFKTSDGKLIPGGKVIAKHGCWSLLKGGLLPNFTSVMEIFLKSKNTKVEIWADNISLQPFTKQQWRSHQEKSIEKVRKRKVKFQLKHANKTALDAAIVSIKQTNSGFPFGCGMNQKILTSTDYQNWFASRFKFTTFTNAMKWYSTEGKQGQENYTIADAMVKFAKQNGISIRGHNILWDDPKYQPDWVKTLSPKELRKAAAKRINSVVTRYAGQLIAWDVVNENLHFRFFEDKLGENASAEFYKKAYQLDPKTTMFMNEYNTTECAEDEPPNAINYKKKLEEIRSFPGNADMLLGIGVQGRFDGDNPPDLAYMRSSLDILASTRLPIWYTEVSVGNGTNQSQYLEEVLREAYSYPAVEGIITFAGPESAGFKEMPLVDIDFRNTLAGDVVDKLLAEWKCETLETISDSGGSFEISLFHGDYNVTVQHPVSNSSTSIHFKVTKDLPPGIVHVQVDARF